MPGIDTIAELPEKLKLSVSNQLYVTLLELDEPDKVTVVSIQVNIPDTVAITSDGGVTSCSTIVLADEEHPFPGSVTNSL